MEDGEASGETAELKRNWRGSLPTSWRTCLTEKREITLPAQLADGTLISWSQDRELGSYLAVLLILPLGMIFLYRDRQQKEKTARKRQADQIRKGLPGFHDQLSAAFQRPDLSRCLWAHRGRLPQTAGAGRAAEADHRSGNGLPGDWIEPGHLSLRKAPERSVWEFSAW